MSQLLKRMIRLVAAVIGALLIGSFGTATASSSVPTARERSADAAPFANAARYVYDTDPLRCSASLDGISLHGSAGPLPATIATTGCRAAEKAFAHMATTHDPRLRLSFDFLPQTHHSQEHCRVLNLQRFKRLRISTGPR
jgi:hypothetical protein